MSSSLLYVNNTTRLEVLDNYVNPSIIQINTGLPGIQGKDGPPGPPGPRGPRGRPAPPSSKIIYTTSSISLVSSNNNLSLPSDATLIKFIATNNSLVTGVTPLTDNEMKIIFNNSPYTISFLSDSIDSSVGNRFLFPTIKLKQFQNISIIYDLSNSGWLLLSTTGIYEDIDGGTSSSF